MVDEGPTIAVVVTVVLGSAEVGVGVVDDVRAWDCDCDDAGDEDCTASLPVFAVLESLVLFDDFEDNAPPTPPPTAAATITIAAMSTIQNVLFRSPHIVLVGDCSWRSVVYAILCVSSSWYW
jgi:hypothetical protein